MKYKVRIYKIPQLVWYACYVVSSAGRPCEMLWDMERWKELQACSWACGQDSLLWNILMTLKLPVGSLHQDVFDRF